MKAKRLSMKAAKAATVQEVHENFIRKCTVRNLSEKTINLYTEHFRIFSRYLEASGINEIAEINLSTIEDFILYLKENTACSDISINTYLRSIRAFLYESMEEGLLPSFKIRIMKTNKEIKETYTDTELKSLLKKPNVKTCGFTEYKMWAFSNYLLGTGNRLSSALEIKIGDLDFESGVIQVNRTKNRKAQIIPLSETLSTVLQDYLVYRKGESGDYVFCNTYGDKADLRSCQKMLARYNKNRGVVKTSAHLYRHTFAKEGILNGGDIFRLQKILGHSDLAVVKEYVNMFGTEIALDFNRFNPLDNMDVGHTRKKIRM